MIENRFRILWSTIWLTACATIPPKPLVIADETTRFNRWLDEEFDQDVQRHPQKASHLGLKIHYDKLDDESEEFDAQSLKIAEERLKKLETFKIAELDEQAKLSYQLFQRENRQSIEGYKFRLHHFPVNQMFGVQSEFPVFMMNVHRVDQLSDAEAYIARLKASSTMFHQIINRMKMQEAQGIIPPRFVFDHVITDSQNLLVGQPFSAKGESPLLADFKRKIDGLKDVDAATKKRLETAGIEALQKDVGPVYRELIAYLKDLKKKAKSSDGVWSLPQGDEFYAFQLQRITTTDMTPEAIHKLGLQEVARIHSEMTAIMKQVGFKGTLAQFFDDMRKNKKFYFRNDSQGRAAYLQESQSIIDHMKSQLPTLFATLPQDELVVKPVEPFREKSAGIAFYEAPALDGTRPGIYYVNLFDLNQVPRYELEALAYHEAIPGHHMQISIAQKLSALPKFRRFNHYTAYVEGWGLYSEKLGKEAGNYQDPYSDFGRLSMELMRAVRLVVDTGIHAQKWTREKAVAYMVKESPSGKGEAVKEIERYFIMPGQATAYMIGKNRLMELREGARQAMGDRFDLRQFHDVILKNGPMPLDLLNQQVAQWVNHQKGAESSETKSDSKTLPKAG